MNRFRYAFAAYGVMLAASLTTLTFPFLKPVLGGAALVLTLMREDGGRGVPHRQRVRRTLLIWLVVHLGVLTLAFAAALAQWLSVGGDLAAFLQNPEPPADSSRFLVEAGWMMLRLLLVVGVVLASDVWVAYRAVTGMLALNQCERDVPHRPSIDERL
jgi:hypothetical protein